MLASIRPYATAGVALVGASVIAAAPVVTPPMPGTQLAVPQATSSAVELSAVYNPLTTWAEVFAGALENGGTIAEEILSNPVPLLRQILSNQIGYVQTVAAAGEGLVEGLVDFLSPDNPGGLIAGMQDAVAELTAGNFAGFVAIAARTALLGPVVAIGLPLLGSGLLEIPATIVQNIANVVTTLTDPLGPLTMALLGGAGAVLGVANAFGDSVQLAIDAVGEADPVGAFTALLNAPGVMAGALMNGYSSLEGFDYPGLLAGGDGLPGLVEVLTVMLPRAIADAVGATGGVPTNPFGGFSLFNEAEASTATTAGILAAKSPTAAGSNTVVDPSTGSGSFVPVDFSSEDQSRSNELNDADDDAAGNSDDAEDASSESPDTPAGEEGEGTLTEVELDDESTNGGTDLTDGNKAAPSLTAGTAAGSVSNDQANDAKPSPGVKKMTISKKDSGDE